MKRASDDNSCFLAEEYLPPVIEIQTIFVEKGFALSGEKGAAGLPGGGVFETNDFGEEL
ncbi:MAG: hypothetical protein LBM63_05265 [Rikenellaceae bacterium]|jgi:hypothetical protein|nr:hypothetical protein [Rikenellaceae bacterium]